MYVTGKELVSGDHPTIFEKLKFLVDSQFTKRAAVRALQHHYSMADDDPLQLSPLLHQPDGPRNISFEESLHK